MKKVSRVIYLIIFLGIFVVIAGFFAYRWQQKNGELKKIIQDKESLTTEIEKIKKTEAFKECDKLEFPKQGPITIQLLGAFRGDYKEHIWSLIIIDPDGYAVGSGLPYEADGMGHGATERMEGAWIAPREKLGDYLIIITPDQDTVPTDTYSLQLQYGVVLAKNAPYSPNQLDRVYILRQTEDAIIPIVPASVGCQY